MIIKKYILETLDNIEAKYNIALTSPNSTAKDVTFYSKLAILEYCGWIEEMMDIIAYRSIKNQIVTQTFSDMSNTIIKKTWGFEYKKHFRKMLIQLIGTLKYQHIEIKLVHQNTLDVFIGELDYLTELRNKAAHTWTSGVTNQFPAPSLLITHLKDKIFPVLRIIYREIIKL